MRPPQGQRFRSDPRREGLAHERRKQRLPAGLILNCLQLLRRGKITGTELPAAGVIVDLTGDIGRSTQWVLQGTRQGIEPTGVDNANEEREEPTPEYHAGHDRSLLCVEQKHVFS
jgi:hypothetical protein